MRPRLLAVLLMSAAACTGDATPAPTATEPDRPTTATLRAENLELLPGNDIGFTFDAADSAATVLATLTPGTARATICTRSSQQTAPDCRTIASGVREPFSSQGLLGLTIGVFGDQPARANVVLEFAEASRSIGIGFPVMRAPVSLPCDDNACNPFFELDPPVGGSFEATATWQGPDAALVLLQGSVRGRSQTATGIPYLEAAMDAGSAPLSIGTGLRAPGEYALVFRHRDLRPGEPPLRDVAITATWPATSS